MQKRSVSGVTIEPLSSSNIQLDCDEDTKYKTTIPVACTHKAMYRIDESVIFTSSYKRQTIGIYGGIIAKFIPDWSDLLVVSVNETLPGTNGWDDLPETIYDWIQENISRIHEICGGKLCVIDILFHPTDSRPIAYQLASMFLVNALQANWASGTDEDIAKIIRGE